MVAIDSVAALTPKAEIEGEMGDSHVGLQARLMSQAMRKLAGTLNRTDTICIFTNQLREKIGVMFGNPETTPGGRALKFYSSVRLDIRRIETLKEGVEAIGNRVRVKVVKNKVAPPFKQAEFDIIYGHGISWEGTVLDAGLERKIVQKSGSYFSFEDERLGQGRQNATAFLREHPDVTQAILQRIQAQLGDDQVVSARLLPVAEPGRPGDGGEEEGRSGRGRRRGADAWNRPRSRSRRKRAGEAVPRPLGSRDRGRTSARRPRRPGARPPRPLGREPAGEARPGRACPRPRRQRRSTRSSVPATSTTPASPRDRAAHPRRARATATSGSAPTSSAQGVVARRREAALAALEPEPERAAARGGAARRRRAGAPLARAARVLRGGARAVAAASLQTTRRGGVG